MNFDTESRRRRHIKCFCERVFVATVMLGLFAGCNDGSTQLSPPNGPEVDPAIDSSDDQLVSSPALAELPRFSIPKVSVVLDGDASEWPESAVVWKHHDKGAVGTYLDVTSTSIGTNQQFLYLFLTCSPSIAEDWKAHVEECSMPDLRDNRADLFMMFIDSDCDRDTGNKPLTNPNFDIGGYDELIRISFPSVRYVDVTKETPVFQYQVLEAEEGGVWFQRHLLENTVVISSLHRLSFESEDVNESDTSDFPVVAIGKDGLEIAVPYDYLSISPGDTIRILVVEYRHRSFRDESMKDYRELVLKLPAFRVDESETPANSRLESHLPKRRRP